MAQENNNIRLITFQDVIVTTTLESYSAYESQKEYIGFTEKMLFDKFKARMKAALKIDPNRNIYPIWCWIPKKDEKFEDDETIRNYMELSTPKGDNIEVLELSVPKEFVFVSNFDLWNEYRFKVRFETGGVITDAQINKLFEKQKGARLQAAIPIITKDHIIKRKLLYDPMKFDYSETEATILNRQQSGEIIIDSNGYF